MRRSIAGLNYAGVAGQAQAAAPNPRNASSRRTARPTSRPGADAAWNRMERFWFAAALPSR